MYVCCMLLSTGDANSPPVHQNEGGFGKMKECYQQNRDEILAVVIDTVVESN